MFFYDRAPSVVVYRELFKAHAQFDVNPEDARRGRMFLSYPELYVYKHNLMLRLSQTDL